METIASNFINTGLSCTITIIGVDGTSYVNAVAMTEIWSGWYKYDFTAYDKNIKYLISTTDGITTQNISNELDSYANKDDFKGWSRGAIVYWADEKTIEARFKTMLEEFKKDTKPHNDLTPELISKIEELQKTVAKIKTPKLKISTKKTEIDYKRIIDEIKKELNKQPKNAVSTVVKNQIKKIEKQEATDVDMDDLFALLELAYN